MKIIIRFSILILFILVLVFNYTFTISTPDTYKIKYSYTLSKYFPYYGKIYSIRLDQEVTKTEDFKDLLDTLDNAKKNDKIIFYLTGYGGESQTTYNIVNNIWTTKAKTFMIVEGPVYSAHAYLAVSGNNLTMKPLSSLMFHSSSILGYKCEDAKGKLDRGKDAFKKCMQFINNELTLGKLLIDSSQVLTKKEKDKIKNGYDIYITAEEYYKRN